MSEEELTISALEERIGDIEDDINALRTKIGIPPITSEGIIDITRRLTALERENKELREKGNDLIKIINAQDQQIRLLISIMNTASVSLKSIIDFIDRLPAANEKVTKDLLSNLLSEDSKKQMIDHNVSDIATSGTTADAMPQLDIQRYTLMPPKPSIGSQLTIDNRRIPYYVDEHPDYKPEINNLRKELVGSITVRLKQVFKTIDGNLILAIEFGIGKESKYHIRKNDFIKIHSCYNNDEDSAYFGEIKALKRFKDTFEEIPINSVSREYGIEIPDNGYDFNYYIHGDIAIDIYR